MSFNAPRWPVLEMRIPIERVIPKLWTANVEHVKLDELTASQPILKKGLLVAIEADPKPPSDLLVSHRRDRPIVVNYNGRLVIWDGHHRLAVAYRKGMKTYEAYVIDEDGSDARCFLRVSSQWGWGEVIVVSESRA